MKAGISLNENGNIVKGPEPDYQERMSLSHYHSTLGTQSNQRKKFHEQRLRKITDQHLLSKSYNTRKSGKLRNDHQISYATESYTKNRDRGNLSFNKSIYNDSIYVKNQYSDWKGEVITGEFKNPKLINSKYSAVVNGAYQTTSGWTSGMPERSHSQQSFHDTQSKSIFERPNTSTDTYGGRSAQKQNESRQTINQHFEKRSSSINTYISKPQRKDINYDLVRNYRSRAFKETQPVYGVVDAYNRQILKNAHEASGSSGINKTHLAVRPASKLSLNEESIMKKSTISLKTLMKKPRERVKQQVQEMINFRRSFYKPKIVS